MKYIWVLFAVSVTICEARSSRIVGGEPASIEDHPSIVQLEDFWSFTGSWMQMCGGTIISNFYVLSAAHCFRYIFSVSEVRIRAGSALRESGGTVIYIDWIKDHPDYGTPGMGNDGDISVLRLSSPLTYSDAVRSIGIPPQGYEVPDNSPVVHAGWGDLEPGSGAGSPVLRDVTIFTVNRELCTERYANDVYGSVVTENMICAGILDVGGKDACQRDSGGPLYFGNTLVGVVSWGTGCGHPNFPGVSTRVSAYTDWIVSLAV